jgi:hypothetical protein
MAVGILTTGGRRSVHRWPERDFVVLDARAGSLFWNGELS